MSVKKGGISGLSGCVEHTSALSELITEARIRNGDLTLVWLDLAIAYGSIPHQLISPMRGSDYMITTDPPP